MLPLAVQQRRQLRRLRRQQNRALVASEPIKEKPAEPAKSPLLRFILRRNEKNRA